MDIKLDGERMLCHKLANGEVKWFTRRANEYSHLYGPVLNDLIRANVTVEACILDGEMVRAPRRAPNPRARQRSGLASFLDGARK
jgi:ATP-dependent DNA ligase